MAVDENALLDKRQHCLEQWLQPDVQLQAGRASLSSAPGPLKKAQSFPSALTDQVWWLDAHTHRTVSSGRGGDKALSDPLFSLQGRASEHSPASLQLRARSGWVRASGTPSEEKSIKCFILLNFAMLFSFFYQITLKNTVKHH